MKIKKYSEDIKINIEVKDEIYVDQVDEILFKQKQDSSNKIKQITKSFNQIKNSEFDSNQFELTKIDEEKSEENVQNEYNDEL